MAAKNNPPKAGAPKPALPNRGGAPLPGNIRSAAEQRMGHDLSGVRVHQNPGAQQLNRQLGAQAATQGSNIHVSRNRSPSLTAHEAAHVVQQGQRPASPKPPKKP